jgi:hypothetical protein
MQTLLCSVLRGDYDCPAYPTKQGSRVYPRAAPAKAISRKTPAPCPLEHVHFTYPQPSLTDSELSDDEFSDEEFSDDNVD